MSAKTPQPIIEVSNLSKTVKTVVDSNATQNDKSFGEKNTTQNDLVILHQVDLVIQSAESIAIVGPSGSGKSTLLGLMAGLDNPSSGSIRLAQQDITLMDEDQRATMRANHVGFVFQSFQLIQSLTALENVMLPLELNNSEDAKAKAIKILQRVGLAERQGHYPTQLSGGEQQRVAIARAFVSEPKILFADEPTGNLDKSTAAQIIDLLFTLNREKHTTLVLVTHDSSLADRCDKRFVLEGGRIIA